MKESVLNADDSADELARLRRELENEVRKKTAELIEQREKLRRLNIQIVMTRAGAVDAKDKYTSGHAFRVAE